MKKILAIILASFIFLTAAWIGYSIYRAQHQVTIEPSGIEVAP